MNTEICKITEFETEKLAVAADIIKTGGLVAFPTETVYGLGMSVFADTQKIYAAKGRPGDNPLIVHVESIKQVEQIAVDIPDEFYKLAQAYWGGPLTMILKKHKRVPLAVTGGLNTVAVRLPSHPIAHSLIMQSGVPIAAPSANLSGKPSPTTAQHVISDLSGSVHMIIDGGSCLLGIESTVLDLSSEVPAILRPGAVTAQQLSEYITLGEDCSNAHKSPGTRYRHYAPNAPLFLVDLDEARVARGRVGVIALNATAYEFESEHVFDAGKTVTEYAARLFFILREFDRLGVEKILAVPPQTEGIGAAVLNRLLRAGERL